MSFFESEEAKSLLNTIGENIFIADTNMKIVWINEYASHLIEKLSDFIPVNSKEDLIGKDIGEFHRHNGEKQKDILKNGPFPYETKINLFNCFTANIVVNPFYVRDRLKGYVLTWKDVTDYEQALTDIRTALDKSSIVAMVDCEGKLSYVNDNFCKLSKYKKNELLGQHYQLVCSEDYTEQFYENIADLVKRGDIWQGETKLAAKDNSDYWVMNTVVPFMKDGIPYQYAAIQQDVTAAKQAEEKLHRSEKLSVLGELAAGVAHEIRNPLTAIKGFTQFNMADNNHKQIMMGEIEQINAIINEFMMLAKPHATDYAPMDMTELINTVIASMEAECRLKNAAFHVLSKKNRLLVHCEENQMAQVFLNLFENAIEAMPHGGNVEVAMSREHEKVNVVIKDEGAGLTEKEIARLGDPHYSLKKNGTGLGLMMTFKIIENHGGSYRVESKVNDGTTVYISLPAYSGGKGSEAPGCIPG